MKKEVERSFKKKKEGGKRTVKSKKKRKRAKRNAVKKIKASWETSLLRRQKGYMGFTCSGIK